MWGLWFTGSELGGYVSRAEGLASLNLRERHHTGVGRQRERKPRGQRGKHCRGAHIHWHTGTTHTHTWKWVLCKRLSSRSVCVCRQLLIYSNLLSCLCNSVYRANVCPHYFFTENKLINFPATSYKQWMKAAVPQSNYHSCLDCNLNSEAEVKPLNNNYAASLCCPSVLPSPWSQWYYTRWVTRGRRGQRQTVWLPPKWLSPWI